jgi:hypothetical protein
MSELVELRELTGRELDAVGGGVLNNFTLQNNFLNTNVGQIGAQIGQQANLVSLNGVFNF